MSRARGRTVCAKCGTNWRKTPPSDAGCDDCKASFRAARREIDRVDAIWAKVKADESPCCDGAKLTGDEDPKDVWFRCAACRLPVYKVPLVRGSLKDGTRQIGIVLHDRFAKPEGA